MQLLYIRLSIPKVDNTQDRSPEVLTTLASKDNLSSSQVDRFYISISPSSGSMPMTGTVTGSLEKTRFKKVTGGWTLTFIIFR